MREWASKRIHVNIRIHTLNPDGSMREPYWFNANQNYSLNENIGGTDIHAYKYDMVKVSFCITLQKKAQKDEY